MAQSCRKNTRIIPLEQGRGWDATLHHSHTDSSWIRRRSDTRQVLSAPRSQYRSQSTDRAIVSQPIAEADRKYRSQLSDAECIGPDPTDRSLPIALIAPIANRSRDQATDRRPKNTDRIRSQRNKTSKVMYFTALELQGHHEPMGK